MLPKYVSGDEGNGIVVTLSQTIVGLVEQKWLEAGSSPMVCTLWPLVFSPVHQDGRLGDLQSQLQLRVPSFSLNLPLAWVWISNDGSFSLDVLPIFYIPVNIHIIGDLYYKSI